MFFQFTNRLEHFKATNYTINDRQPTQPTTNHVARLYWITCLKSCKRNQWKMNAFTRLH